MGSGCTGPGFRDSPFGADNLVFSVGLKARHSLGFRVYTNCIGFRSKVLSDF